MTVGELRKLLKGVGDNREVFIYEPGEGGDGIIEVAYCGVEALDHEGLIAPFEITIRGIDRDGEYENPPLYMEHL